MFITIQLHHSQRSGAWSQKAWPGGRNEEGHPHKFRRTMATVAIDKGMPIEQAQKLLGHEKIDTTLHFAMVKQSNVKNAHREYIG